MQVKRKCGKCMACCYTHKVEPLNKPGFEWCKYSQKRKGCIIYSRRPDVCQVYTCGWINGLGADDLRPDKCGFTLNLYENISGLNKLFHIYEFRKGALLKPVVMQIIDYISELNIPIILISEKTKKITIFKIDTWNKLSEELQVAYEDFSKVTLLE